MRNVDISIIIPCYNASAYLNSCINTLLQQSFCSWEAIFVNDGSSDDTLNLLMYFSTKDQRIKVYSKPNQGAAKAREYGIGKSTGNFITFLDVDDTLTSNYLKQMIQAFDKDIDIVVSGFNIIKNGIIAHQKTLNPCELSSIKYLKKVLCGKYGWELCGKMYRKELFSKAIKTPKEIRIGEDAAVFIQLILYSNRIKIIKCNAYNYIQHKESASHIRSEKYAEETLYAAFFIEDILRKTPLYKEVKNDIDAMFLLFYSNSTRKYILNRKHPLIIRLKESHWNISAFSKVPFYKAFYILTIFYLRS